MMLLLCFLGLLGSLEAAGQTNKTETTAQQERVQRQLGIFNVVTFPNDPCAGNNGLNGTCYTGSECAGKGGSSQGSCAAGFGVCCTITLACGGSSSENMTYAIIGTYSTSNDEDPCVYKICKRSADICKLRIDFESFTIATATAFTTNAADGLAQLYGLAAGKCDSDVLTISNPGGPSPPKICGVNTGQHMYIDASDQCNNINIDIDTGSSTTRNWNIKVTQHTCESRMQPQKDCLQWHTGTSGTIFNFGWDTSVTTVSSTSHIHQQTQYYDICFRRERGYCSLCFTPQIFTKETSTATAGPFTSFGVSGAAIAAGKSSIDSLCGSSSATASGVTTVSPNPVTMDYIEVLNLQPTIGATDTLGAGRICGTVFNSAPTAVVHATTSPSAASTSCTWSTPFKWGVRFNSEEIGDKTGDVSATAQNTAEHYGSVAGAGMGYTGFYMAWWQNTC